MTPAEPRTPPGSESDAAGRPGQLDTTSPDALAVGELGLEPLPGPPGYHADFSLPFGKPEAAQFWTVRVPNGYGFDTYGPFEVESEAVRWAFSIDCPRPWIVEPLRRPEDWPGKALMEPEEPDMPLLDGLEM